LPFRSIGEIADALRETASFRSFRPTGECAALTSWRFGGRFVVEYEDVDHRRNRRREYRQ